MVRRRTLLLPAILTALMMAPSSAFAARPNDLRTATVAPSTGTTATPFLLTADYLSTAGNAASGVTATFGDRAVPLSLTAGTPISGTWTATTTLPAGSWTITFQAETAKGAEPKRSVGSVVVTSPWSPSPSPPGGSAPSGEAPPPRNEPSSSGAPAPTASSPPATAEAKPRATSQPTAPRATMSPAAAPNPPGTHGAGPKDIRGTRPTKSPRAGARPGPGITSPPDGSAGTPGGQLDGQPNLVLLVGILAAASAALLAAGWIAIGGRRMRPEEVSADAGTAGDDPAVAAIPAVERRALRRARLRASDDPILAALGIPESERTDGLEGRLPRRTQRVKRRR